MKTRPSWFYSQSAVIPYRRKGDGIEVLLITSWSKRRWTIPKGVVDRGEPAAMSAAREAFEEAGVRGTVDDVGLGTFTYKKWGGVCTVEVFPLHVQEVLDVWPESDDRQRKWLSITDATEAIHRDELRAILDRLVARLA